MKAAFLSMIAVLPCIPGVALSMTVPELQRKIKDQDGRMISAKFEYFQEMRSAAASEVVKAKGLAYFMKPRNFRIEQSEPDRQIIVASGKSVFVYTPKFKQALKDSWKRWAKKNSFFPGLFGSSETFEHLEKNFLWEIGQVEALGGEKVLKVALKESGSLTDEGLSLWLGAEDFVPRKAEFKSGGLSLVTTLFSLELNPKLDPGLFRFTPPKGTTVVQVP